MDEVEGRVDDPWAQTLLSFNSLPNTAPSASLVGKGRGTRPEDGNPELSSDGLRTRRKATVVS